MFHRLFRQDENGTTEIDLAELEARARDDEQEGSEDDGNESESNGGFYEHWAWIAWINAMSNNDMTKWNYFDDMGVIEFFNHVCFYKDRIEHQNELENKRNNA